MHKAQRYERAREVARILQLEPLLNRKPKELSGRQRQGVAIGRALVLAGGETVIVQIDGDDPAIMHDYVPIYINGELCHLFDQNGEAIPKVHRHHLTQNESHEQQYQHRLSNQVE
ncbi:hypothetical protein [Nostoc sp.]|uniref:hypothetical protein n=1 Tax=Nostoc sp. TaxID=1180 RepID=UPI002FF63EB0